ncbi:MAG: hypothetical protein AAGG01_12490 [Planctomycetota bacterium]
MLTAFLLVASPLTSAPAAIVTTVPTSVPPISIAAGWEDFKDKLKAAKKDPEKLWELYQWALEDDERKKYRKRVLKALIKVDPGHEEAREALGHVAFEDKWFETTKARDKYIEKVAEERGLVRFGGDWVPAIDVPFLARGLVKNKYDEWVDPVAEERKAQGWKQQDLVWVKPDEFPNLEKGLYKCGDKWLSLEAANEWHDDFDAPWRIPTERAVIWSTATRETAMKAAEEAKKAYYDMRKVFGYGGDLPVPFMVVKDQGEYLRFMDGDVDYDIPQVDPIGISGHSRAAFADMWFDFEASQYNGMGVTYWDAGDPNGAAYGIHDARFAYGLSFVESIDPAFQAVNNALQDGEDELNPNRFLPERFGSHRLPMWFRWGAANYASRWFKDQQVGKGGNPKWAFEWSASNLRSQGGLASMDEIFEFRVGLEVTNTASIVMSAGLLVAYLVDGDNPELSKLLTQAQTALEKGKDVTNIMEEIRNGLEDSEEKIRAFAGL